MLNKDDETIIAQSTPDGSGAIALIRLSGLNSKEIISKISYFPKNKSIFDFKSNTANLGYIIDENKNKIDQVIFIIFDGPNTFTGQDIIEITCHNNRFIVQEIISLAIKNGARYAQNGEFTKRALLNNKIDLIQAEAINDLINSNNQLSLKKALAQVEGSFSNWVLNLEKKLLKAITWSQATFEFLDEEVNFNNQIKDFILDISLDIKNIKKNFDIQEQIKNGIRIAIIGSVNAGKSSIFNALLNKNRAIVTNIAGTTRDTIEASINLYGNYCTLIDTAGIRKTEDIIEQEGIKKSLDEAAKADIILLILDGSRIINSQEEGIYKNLIKDYDKKIILISNKSDVKIDKYNFENIIEISALTKNNFKELENSIDLKIKELFSSINSPFLLNKRHFNLLSSIEKKIEGLINKFNNNSFLYHELISYDISEILQEISELTGKSVAESSLDLVFKEFCIGK